MLLCYLDLEEAVQKKGRGSGMKKVCDERSFTRLDWVLKIQLRYEFMC